MALVLLLPDASNIRFTFDEMNIAAAMATNKIKIKPMNIIHFIVKRYC
jgi:hypothetical protein